MKKRCLAAFMSAVMAFAMLPTAGLPVYAAEGDTEYVSLPITIRDYAADGMLFQWNELGATGDQVVGASIATPTVKYTEKAGGGAYNATTGDGYVRYTSESTGIYITYSVSGSYTRDSMRYGVVKYRTNANYSGTQAPSIRHRWSNTYDDKAFPTTGYNQNEFKSVVVDLGFGTESVSYVTLYPRLASGAYIDIAEIAFFSSKTDADNYASGTATGGETYHHGSTKGYGLLQTNAKDHFNDLADSAAISGTTLTENGTWNSSEVTTSESTLNSGAKQTLYGCYVRTDLVEPKLDANKKPVYTEATVTYLANYMQKTLPVVWKNSDGSYNMWYVMGTKLFNDNNEYVGPGNSATQDMASVLRSTITGGLGSYADTKGKTLSKITDCTTYFDAAYFLLHNIFADNEGYGQTVTEYSNINLVKKTVDGKSYYVYNSAYDGTKYDTTNGVISNTQTDRITTREGTTYVRGNKQPESRFDPIAAIGEGNAYYGKNGDPYADAVNDNGNDKYYNATNYNLTLEGHAQFIYYEDDDLYFNFTGDDDVYLYINGIRVLDLGGAHAISKCGISLNAVQQLCGLKDGEVYDFDFYYMERHGTAANFGIETNIKIVDPSMLTEKNAYQDEQAVGYNGFVNPNKPVTYSFKLTNNGDAQIQNLTFKDDDIGVNLTKDTITLNDDTKINDLAVQVLNENGSTKESYAAGNLTEEKLKQLLTNGLSVGESILIYGFNYSIPNTKWSENKFPNTVYTTAISTGENASHKNLNGIASCQVQKQEFQFEPMHYYEWKGRGVTATKAELIRPVLDADQHSGVTVDNADIKLCSASGQISEAGINSKAKVTDQGILYTGTATGSDTYYYKVGNYGPIAVTVYSYDVADNTYVLDYSLPVELNNDDDFGLRLNDTLKLSSNPYATTDSITGISVSQGKYGTFDWKYPSLKYTMSDFMDGEDTTNVTIQVLEDGADELTTKTGVTMTQKITTVPASVVYYEDDFAAIDYKNTDTAIVDGDGNKWELYKSADAGDQQSADPNSNYGSDPNYSKDKTGELKLVDGNDNQVDSATLEGDASNGTIHKLTVKNTEDVLSFDFKGTGFEIISRTTSEKYAVISVKVEKLNENNNSPEIVKEFPVITECKNGDLYQVPIISVTDLPYDRYKVTLSAAKSTTSATRELYIDGIRIYGPLSEDDQETYYNADEAAANITEIKKLIKDGIVAYADVSTNQLVSGSTVIENLEEGSDIILTTTDTLDDYLKFGPNNELYLDGSANAAVIAFYLTPDKTVDDSKRTIQIGAHRKAEVDNTEAVTLAYGSDAETVDSATDTNSYSVASGTEQYYTIDVSNLQKDEQGRYLVLIGTNGGNNFNNTLALTNLKIAGYTMTSAESEIQKAADAGEGDLFRQVRAYSALRKPKADEPAVNENLNVISAELKSAKVSPGKTATLSVTASEEAETLEVLDADGNLVEFTKVAKKSKKGNIVFTAAWKVTGSRGDKLEYTVRVKDADGAVSVNQETVSITIK